MEAVVHLAGHPDGAGYYFFDETWSTLYGPYESEEKARHALLQYAKELDGPPSVMPIPQDPQDFWDQQYEENKEGEIIGPIPSDEQIMAAWSQDTAFKPTERIDLQTLDDLKNLEGLIDGGYMSFIYGSRKSEFGGWNNIKMRYCNYLMLLDSGGVRQNEYELYKSRRNERRDQYDYMAETYERVKQFREILKNDPMVNTARIDGYEADDIIALLFVKGIGNKRVIAQDKDFFQVPGMRKSMTDHQGIPQINRGLKLPKYAIEPKSPASWALTQAIFGDKSDSIPRLLPSRTGYRELYTSLIKRAPNLLSAFWNCHAEFGDQFEVNLRLILLPHPTLADQDYDLVNLLYEDLCSGRYWDPDNYDDKILQEALDSIHEMEW